MMVRSPIAIVFALALAIVSSTAQRSVARIETPQTFARPGDVIQLKIEDEHWEPNRPMHAVFDHDVRASVRSIGHDIVELWVPVLPVGDTTVSIYQGDNLLGRRRLEIRDTTTRRLMFEYRDEEFRLVRSIPVASPPTGHVRSRDGRLSFDLVNELGAVIYSGTILDPTQVRGEVMISSPNPSGASVLGRGEYERSGIIFVDIPTPPNNATVRIYRAGEDVDLFTVRGRTLRHLVAEISVRP